MSCTTNLHDFLYRFLTCMLCSLCRRLVWIQVRKGILGLPNDNIQGTGSLHATSLHVLPLNLMLRANDMMGTIISNYMLEAKVLEE